MKNSVFASLFVEAINNAREDNGTAHAISGMLTQIEQKEVARRSRVQKNTVSEAGKKENPSIINSDTGNYSPPQESSRTVRREISPENDFLRDRKQREYRKLIAERPYYFLTLESLIEKKSDARTALQRAKVKYADFGNLSKLHQAEQKYLRVIKDADREIQIKVRERQQKGQKIPRSLLVNDGFELSEEGIKRDERRRQLIAEEARAAAAHREAITKVSSHLKPAPLAAVIQPTLRAIPFPVAPPEPPHSPVTEISEVFDRALYYELLLSMPRDEAWRIAKSQAQKTAVQKTPLPEGEFSYINTLCYRLQLSAGANHATALHVATDRERAEAYLCRTISDRTTNRIRMRRVPSVQHRVGLAPERGSSVKFTEMRHFNVTDSGRYQHLISVRSASLQADFKTRVMDNFYQRCAVTGQKISALLQACHIEDYALSGNMNTDNGILLSADCHRLFDEDLMGIEPEKLTVHFKVRCIYSAMFEGKRIHPHRLAMNKAKLKNKWGKFQSDITNGKDDHNSD